MILYDKSDQDLVITLAKCSLERSPGKNDNWVERAGKLPSYIEEIACALHRKGRSISSSIAIAVSRVKAWASGRGNVNADTRAKAMKAVAQWTALKAKNKAKKLKMSAYPDGSEYILLSEVDSFSLDKVRDAWDSYMREVRESLTMRESGLARAEASDVVPYSWVREVWSDYIIVEIDSPRQYLKVPYSVDNGTVVFSVPEEVEQVWVSKN